MYKNSKKFSYLILAGAMLLSSFTGCGKKDTTVVDYGVDPSNPESTQVSSPGDSTSSSASVKTSSKTLREQFGDAVKWQDPFTAQDVSFSTNKVKNIPDVEFLNMYEVKSYDVSSAGEQEFADKFFDDGATKLEELKYVDDTSYMIQMYKYRNLEYIFQISELDEAAEDEDYDKDFSIITADSGIDYKWVDGDTYSIHMYEGKYNGINYGLIIGYSPMDNRKYVFFEPTDIREYYPDYEFKTLMLESDSTQFGGTLDSGNACALEDQEIQDLASAFVQEKFGISDFDAQMSNNFNSYNDTLGDLVYYMSDSQGNAGGRSVMTFSDGDYISTTDYLLDANGFRSADCLAEQDDLVKTYMDEHNIDFAWEGFYRALMNDSNKTPANVVRDGYAVYLNTPFSVGVESANSFLSSYRSSVEEVNSGCVMVTSKGIYGVDMVLGLETIDVTESVELADFQTITDSCVQILDENLDLPSLGNPTNMNLSSIDLVYEAKEDEDGDGVYEVVPAWAFYFSDESRVIYVVVDAIDGSYVYYYQFKF